MASKNILISLSSGCRMPLLGLGTWKSEKDKVITAVKAAIDAGYRHIDCAYDYANEEGVGIAIKSKIEDGTIKREDLFVTSKLWCTFHHPDDVEEGVRLSLKDLQLSYLDLYLIHWPFAFPKTEDRYPVGPDGRGAVSDTPLIDTWKGMESLVEKGLVRSIGVSNLNMNQLKDLVAQDRKYPIANHQIELSPYLVQDDMIDYCRSQNISVTAYSPLGSNDREDKNENDPVLMDDPVIKDMASKRGKSVAQILLRYHLQQGVACVPKSITPARIRENFESLDFELTDSEITQLKTLDRNMRYCTYHEMSHHPLHPFPPEK